MTKVSVMYPNRSGVRFDHDYYREKHMPLVKRRMGAGLKYYTVDKGLSGATPNARRRASLPKRTGDQRKAATHTRRSSA